MLSAALLWFQEMIFHITVWNGKFALYCCSLVKDLVVN